MSRSSLLWVALLVIPPAMALERPEVTYQVFQFPPEMIPRIDGNDDDWAIVPDSYDYAPTGQTVAQMWNDGDETVRRGMVLAVKKSWGITLTNHEGQWVIAIGTVGSKDLGDANGIVDLGNGLCFRQEAA